MNTRPTWLTKGGVLLLGGASTMRQSVRVTLQAENYEVLAAANCDQAQVILDTGLIDILVVDVDNPPAPIGPWLAQVTAPPHRPLGIIGLGEPRVESVPANRARLNVWIEKPPSPTRLVAAVNRLVAERRAEIFRAELLRRHTAPFFIAGPWRHGGLNE